MEKITITEISADKFAKPNAQGQCAKFWGVTLADGRTATVWDAGIADTIRANINVPSEAEIKTTNGFANIRAFKGGETTITSENPVMQENAPQPTQAPAPQKLLSEKDRQIMAQTFTKCVFYGNKAIDEDHVLKVYKEFYDKL